MAERPSDSWTGFDGLTPKAGKKYDQIKHVLSDDDFGKLGQTALSVWKSCETLGNVTCTINISSFAYGCNNLAVEVAFSDGVYWIARIQHVPVYPSFSREHTPTSSASSPR